MDNIEYFENCGDENTNRTIDIVQKRLKSDDIEAVVVASTTGATGVRYAQALQGQTKVIAVSYREMKSEFKEQMKSLGAIYLDKTHVPFDYDGTPNLIRETYRTISQGFKVAVEVILIATDFDQIKPSKEIIGVAGTEKGADTIIVAKSTKTKDMFSEDDDLKFEVHEILAFPKEKFWW